MESIPSLRRRTVTRLIAIAALLLTGATQVFGQPTNGAAQTADIPATNEWLPGPAVTDEDLLANGGLNGDYYWAYPNHYTAPEWGRWWIDGSPLPEYDRSRDSTFIEGDRSQRMHTWYTFVSGIYQVATVMPCTNYQLDGWTRSHSVAGAHPNTRIGLDPTGTQLTKSQSSGAVTGLPALTRWSATGTQLSTWEQFTVQAEAFGGQITAIVYAAPQPGSDQTHYYDIYFDALSLTEIAFPDDRLPAPSSWTPTGFISNLTTDYAGGTLTVEWDTTSEASTQVWYSIENPSEPVTPTTSYTYTTYLPIISSFRPPTAYMTTLDTTPVLHHQAVITGLESSQYVTFVALSRRPISTSCTTETSELTKVAVGSGQMTTLDSSRVREFIPEPVQHP